MPVGSLGGAALLHALPEHEFHPDSLGEACGHVAALSAEQLAVPSDQHFPHLGKLSLVWCSMRNSIIHGVFFEWDNTPRHGTRGYIIKPPRKEQFMSLMKRSEKEEYIFIKAWNEWAEGMMLEPTEEDGYKYLEWIKTFRDS